MKPVSSDTLQQVTESLQVLGDYARSLENHDISTREFLNVLYCALRRHLTDVQIAKGWINGSCKMLDLRQDCMEDVMQLYSQWIH